jgi:serine protease
MSLGGGGFSQVAQDVYTDVRAQGVIIIAAAGNESTDEPSYPASYQGIVSVSAAAHGEGGTPSDVILAQYSNFGATVDVSAPGGQSFVDSNGDGFGDGVLSTVGLSLDSSGYASFNGTSMAAPHVAGVAALMKSVHRNLTPDQFDEALTNRTIVLDVGSSGRDDSFGTGLIDAFNAVRIAEQLAGISPTPQPDNPAPEPAEPLANAAANPSSLNFGSGLLSLNMEIRNSGDTGSSLNVSSITTNSTALIVASSEIDSNGLGTYAVTIDREQLADGSNQLEININTNANSVNVPVNIFMPISGPSGNAGQLHVVLLDASSLRQQDCALLSAEEGLYSVEFEDVETGDYFALAGSDSDGDGLICGPFEACGAYESLGNISQITEEEVDLTVTYSLFDLFPSGQFRGCN